MALANDVLIKPNGDTYGAGIVSNVRALSDPLDTNISIECSTSCSSDPPSCIPSAQDDGLVPVPPSVPSSGMSIQAHKLWIGNLDKRLSEQNILKFVTPHGKIASFKYLLHTSGIEKGEPRGYCFVEYTTREEAERAKSALHGKLALGRKLIVDWARPDMQGRKIGNLVSETWDPSSVSATLQGDASTKAKIAAIEAKLKQMENEGKRVQNQRTAVIEQAYSNKDRKQGHNLKLYRPNKPYSRIEIRTRK